MLSLALAFLITVIWICYKKYGVSIMTQFAIVGKKPALV